MDIFIDTSAFYALLDADDQNHERAKSAWIPWLDEQARFSCSNYVLLESSALIQRRLGMMALRRFQEDIIPLCQVHWVSPNLHAAALSALLAAGRRRLSLVDCTSFEIMRRLGLRTVFAFDRHFAELGFTCLP
ncbi:MAG: PIN domain-containing protein [Chloroflexota bacterium]|nr:PIN domain-containing protein [Chloroflexota bacterium]